MLACLDELPSTAPLPTLRTRMANERALGVSFIYAAQTWRQLAAVFGEQEARALFGLTNVLLMFGGSKDVAFNQEISDLVGQTFPRRPGKPAPWLAAPSPVRTLRSSGRKRSAGCRNDAPW
jgi:type IV secretion system protein VirD4